MDLLIFEHNKTGKNCSRFRKNQDSEIIANMSKVSFHLNYCVSVDMLFFFHHISIKVQYSPDNLTLANSHVPDNSHDCLIHNSL